MKPEMNMVKNAGASAASAKEKSRPQRLQYGASFKKPANSLPLPQRGQQPCSPARIGDDVLGTYSATDGSLIRRELRARRFVTPNRHRRLSTDGVCPKLLTLQNKVCRIGASHKCGGRNGNGRILHGGVLLPAFRAPDLARPRSAPPCPLIQEILFQALHTSLLPPARQPQVHK